MQAYPCCSPEGNLQVCLFLSPWTKAGSLGSYTSPDGYWELLEASVYTFHLPIFTHWDWWHDVCFPCVHLFWRTELGSSVLLSRLWAPEGKWTYLSAVTCLPRQCRIDPREALLGKWFSKWATILLIHSGCCPRQPLLPLPTQITEIKQGPEGGSKGQNFGRALLPCGLHADAHPQHPQLAHKYPRHMLKNMLHLEVVRSLSMEG